MNPEYIERPMEVKDVGDDGTFTAYISTFGGRPDDGNDIIQRGAFLQTLTTGGRNGNGVMMLRDHDPKRIPGKWLSLEENARGLKGVGELFIGDGLDGTELGRETYTLMKRQGLKGISMGFSLPKRKGAKSPFDFDPESYERDEKTNVRTIKRLNLWEASPVAFPMNRGATITAVKSLLEEATTEREYETALREAGLSREAAKHVVSLMRPSLREADEGTKSVEDVSEALIAAIRAERVRFNLDGIL